MGRGAGEQRAPFARPDKLVKATIAEKQMTIDLLPECKTCRF